MNKYGGIVEQTICGKKHHTLQLLRLPNNVFSKIFLWYFRRYMNTHTYKLKVRGRKSKVSYGRKKGWKWLDSVPLSEARVLGVYVNNKITERRRSIQCGSCEKISPSPDKGGECPNCGSGNWVFGCIDEKN